MNNCQMSHVRREKETIANSYLWDVFEGWDAMPHVLVTDKWTGRIIFETHNGIADIKPNTDEVMEAIRAQTMEKYGTTDLDMPEAAEEAQRYWDEHISVTLTAFAPHGQDAQRVTFKSAETVAVDEYVIIENVMEVTVIHFPTVCVIMYGTIADEAYREAVEEAYALKQKYRCNSL